MTIEIPSRRTAALSGSGHGLDYRGGGAQWSCALRALNDHLRQLGLETRVDSQIGAIDATLRCEKGLGSESRRTQRTVLRPHRGRLWWWLRASGEDAEAPFLSPLTPATDAAVAARRILGVLTQRQSRSRFE